MSDTLRVGFNLAADIAGLVGMVLCLGAGAARISGGYHVVGFETMTVFVAGIGLVVSACFVKLWLLERRPSP